MRKIILLALAIALIAVPAFASVQNVKVSGEVDSTFLRRDGFDLGFDADSNNDANPVQNLFITQIGLRVDADLTDNVSATIALINEREWGNSSLTVMDTSENADHTQGSEIDINLAYVTLREMLYSPLTVVIGRQDFRYGNSLIIDSRGPNNAAATDSGLNNVAEDLSKQSAMDAIRLILDYDPLKVELLWAKIDHNVSAAIESTATGDDDIDLYGINLTYDLGDDMDSVVETYLFVRKDQTSKQTSNTTFGKTDVIKVVGIRGSTNPNFFDIEGLNLQAEVAHQGGTYNSGRNSGSVSEINQTRDAWAVQLIANYQVPLLEEYKPVLQYVYTKLSGNSRNHLTKEGSDDEWNAWDPLYENQGGSTIYNALFNNSDCIYNQISLTADPIEDVTAKLTYTKLWTEEPLGTVLPLVRVDGSAAINAITNDSKRQLGQELDLDVLYNYTEDVAISAALGYFIPGNAFAASENAKQFLLGVDVKF